MAEIGSTVTVDLDVSKEIKSLLRSTQITCMNTDCGHNSQWNCNLKRIFIDGDGLCNKGRSPLKWYRKKNGGDDEQGQ